MKNYSVSQGVAQDEPSWFGNVLIPPPRLNISAFWIPDFDLLGDTDEYFIPMEKFRNRSRTVWRSPERKLYTISDILSKGQCQTIEVCNLRRHCDCKLISNPDIPMGVFIYPSNFTHSLSPHMDSGHVLDVVYYKPEEKSMEL